MQTQPIGVACPRCSDDIMCTVEVKLLTGHRTDMRLVDLADRFAEHYVAAGHVASIIDGVRRTRRDLAGSLTGEVLNGVKVTAATGLMPPWTQPLESLRPKPSNAVTAYARGENPTIREAPGPGWRELAEGSPDA